MVAALVQMFCVKHHYWELDVEVIHSVTTIQYDNC